MVDVCQAIEWLSSFKYDLLTQLHIRLLLGMHNSFEFSAF